MPDWICGGCGLKWPCETRQRELTAEYDSAPVSLALLMSSYFVEAAEDLPYEPAGPMYDRFIGWARIYQRRV